MEQLPEKPPITIGQRLLWRLRRRVVWVPVWVWWIAAVVLLWMGVAFGSGRRGAVYRNGRPDASGVELALGAVFGGSLLVGLGGVLLPSRREQEELRWARGGCRACGFPRPAGAERCPECGEGFGMEDELAVKKR